MTDACPDCQKPVFPHASESVKASGQVCVCGSDSTPQQSRPEGETRLRGAQQAKQPKSAKPAAVDWEAMFLRQLKDLGAPAPFCQFMFHPRRKYRIDACWPDKWVAVELEGGAHAVKTQLAADQEKFSALSLAGWTVLRYSNSQVKDGSAARAIVEVLRAKGGVER